MTHAEARSLARSYAASVSVEEGGGARRRVRREKAPRVARQAGKLRYDLSRGSRWTRPLGMAAAVTLALTAYAYGPSEKRALFLVGGGFTAAAFALASRHLRRSMEVDRSSGAITVADEGGATALLPRGAIVSLRATTRAAATDAGESILGPKRSYALQLDLRDGGALELESFVDLATPTRIASEVRAVLERTQGVLGPFDPVDLLAGSRSLRARRMSAPPSGYRASAGEPGALEVSWSLRRSALRSLARSLGCAAVVFFAFGFFPQPTLRALCWILAFAVAALVFLTIAALEGGVEMVIVVDGAKVRVERRRGRRNADGAELPTGAVDHVHVTGEGLYVCGPETPPGTAALGGVLPGARTSAIATLSGLGLADVVQLYLAIAEEIARRAAAAAGRP
jgi:hypothetical protein